MREVLLTINAIYWLIGATIYLGVLTTLRLFLYPLRSNPSARSSPWRSGGSSPDARGAALGRIDAATLLGSLDRCLEGQPVAGRWGAQPPRPGVMSWVSRRAWG